MDGQSLSVAAAYTKNGDPATFHLPNDLANDLAAYVATRPIGDPVFPLTIDKGRGDARGSTWKRPEFRTRMNPGWCSISTHCDAKWRLSRTRPEFHRGLSRDS